MNTVSGLVAALLGGLMMAACSAQHSDHATSFLVRYDVEPAQPTRLPVCYGHGCKWRGYAHLEDQEWNQIRDLFGLPPLDAAEERRRIAQAIALLETVAGEQIGTREDRRGTFGKENSGRYQLDCVDESLNTTSYLHMLKAEGFLKFHQLRGPDGRFTGWPHTTAAIFEISTGEGYAVDSWFYDNGTPPVIIPLTLWGAGWFPEDWR